MGWKDHSSGFGVIFEEKGDRYIFMASWGKTVRKNHAPLGAPPSAM